MTTTATPMCAFCARRSETDWTCEAFPEGIPNALDLRRADHRLPILGDGGLTFVPRDQSVIATVNEIWGADPQPYTGPVDPPDPSQPSF